MAATVAGTDVGVASNNIDVKACIFCGDEAGKLTNEHVWPQWLRKYPAYEDVRRQQGPRPAWDDFEIITDEEGRFVNVSKPRPGHVPILPEVKVKVVCATCNNGWMSRLENDAQSLLQRLMADERFDLSEPEQELLALWTTKTMLLYSKCRELIHQPFGDHEFRSFTRLGSHRTTPSSGLGAPTLHRPKLRCR